MFAEIYAALSRRDAMLLMATMFFSADEADDLFHHLPDDTAEKMHAFSKTILQVPKKKRLALLVREIRRLMSARSTHRLEGVDPSWLVSGFRGEKPRVIAMVLMHMPSSITRQVIERLPAPVREALPPRSELRSVSMDIVRLVRSRFDARFAMMEIPRELKKFEFHKIIALEARELIVLARALGVEELARAFVSVGKRALAELLRRMPRENAEELIVAVKKVSRVNAMELKAAQHFLARVLINFQNTDELFQKAGLYQLGSALVIEDRDFVRQLCQRFPRAHGRLLEDYLAKIKESDAIDARLAQRLQNNILENIQGLSSRGKINTRYIESDFVMHEDE